MTEVKLKVENLLSYKEAAEILKVSRPAIYWMVDNGKLRSMEIGGKRFVLKEDVKRLQKERAATGAVAALSHKGVESRK